MGWIWAFSTNAFKRFSLEEAIRAIAKAGYGGVEILADEPHAFPLHTDRGAREKISAILRECGLVVSNLNAFTLFAIKDTYHPSWISADPAERAKRVEHTVAALGMAHELGAPTISTEPGGLLNEVKDRVQALAWFREGLLQALPAAAERRVKLLVEPEPGCLFEQPVECLAFLESLGAAWHPWLGMNYDLGHFYCVGVDLPSLIRRQGREIPHIHLEDIAASRVHEHLTPGAGAINFREVLGALSQVNYQGFVTVELYPYQDKPAEAAEAAMRHLSALMRDRVQA